MNLCIAQSSVALRHKSTVPTDARRLARRWEKTRQTRARPYSANDLLTRGSMSITFEALTHSSDDCGRNVHSVPYLDVATGQMGEARGTTMANVNSAIETGVSFAL